ncbi:MAG: ATP-binding protein, partial [Chitinophaga sp.]
VPDVSYMAYEHPGVMWVGSGRGLYKVDLSNGKTDSIAGLNGHYVRSIHVAGPDEIWVTTYDQGFFLLQKGRLYQMPLDKLQYLATAHCIAEDDKGFFWITTNKGLFQVARRDLLAYAAGESSFVFYLYYGKNKGFNTNEFNGGCQPCALKLPDGNLSLPSLDGLVMFAPSRINAEVPDKAVFVDNVQMDTRPIAFSDTIALPDNYQQLRLEVSTPYFGDAYNLQLFYMLEGGEGEGIWLPVEADGSITFSRLHSGGYRLRIRKVNGFGAHNYTDRVVHITVKIAWYEEWWFRLLIAGFLGLLVFIFMRIRLARSHYKNRMLEMRVSERTRRLEETLEFLQSSERQLHQQALMQQRLIAAITHDIKTPMKFLLLTTRAMKEQDRQHAALYETHYRMYHLIGNLIQYMKMQFSVNGASSEMLQLDQLLEEKVGIFRPIAQLRNVEIVHLRRNGAVPALVNRQLLGVVVHNLLDNAVKYTTSGSITLETERLGDMAVIRIIDTGVGIHPRLAEHINTLVPGKYLLGDHRWPDEYRGLGLLMVTELLQLINGRLKMQPNEGGGTKVSVVLHLVS